MLLDLAGLDKQERVMIQASIGNARDFEKIAEALILQHPRIHLVKQSESRKPGFRPKGRGKGKGKRKRKFRAFVNHKTRNLSNFAGVMMDDGHYEDDYECSAYIGAEDEDEPYNDPAHWYEDDEEEEDHSAYPYWEEADVVADTFNAYVTEEWSKRYSEENMAETALEAAELDCVALLSNNLGADCFEYPETPSDFIQSGAVAFLTGRKGKGKGKGKGKHPLRPSNLSIEDRRKKLKELKAKTECKDCGRKGHWRGDKECTMQKNRVSHYTHKSFCESFSSGLAVDSDTEEPTVLMAVKARPKPVKEQEASPPPGWTFPPDQHLSVVTESSRSEP
jgi:hypothetical protein